jgi:hypothetical protein
MVKVTGNYSLEFNKKERTLEITRNEILWRSISAFSLKEGLYYLIDELVKELNQSELDNLNLNKMINEMKNLKELVTA